MKSIYLNSVQQCVQLKYISNKCARSNDNNPSESDQLRSAEDSRCIEVAGARNSDLGNFEMAQNGD